MAYLEPHFDPDVFVSYSHGDRDGVGSSELKAWTHKWVDTLERYIQAYLGRKEPRVTLYIDRKGDRTIGLTEEIRATLKNSGILLIVMSPAYLTSSWCRDERQWFGEQLGGDLGYPSRVFVIHAQTTDKSEWPPFLCDSRRQPHLGFPFYDEFGLPCHIPKHAFEDREFKQVFNDFWEKFVARLKAIRDKAEKKAAREATRASRPTGPLRVYLHAPWGCEEARADYAAALSSLGIDVVTAGDNDGEGLDTLTRDSKDLIHRAGMCDAMVLLRTGDDVRFVRNAYSVGVLNRRQIVARRGGKPLPCAILDVTGRPLLDEKGNSLDGKLADYDIVRFDVDRGGAWRSLLQRWLRSFSDISLAQAAQ